MEEERKNLLEVPEPRYNQNNSQNCSRKDEESVVSYLLSYREKSTGK